MFLWCTVGSLISLERAGQRVSSYNVIHCRNIRVRMLFFSIIRFICSVLLLWSSSLTHGLSEESIVSSPGVSVMGANFTALYDVYTATFIALRQSRKKKKSRTSTGCFCCANYSDPCRGASLFWKGRKEKASGELTDHIVQIFSGVTASLSQSPPVTGGKMWLKVKQELGWNTCMRWYIWGLTLWAFL